MPVVSVIVGGIITMTLIAGIFDYLGKRAKGGDPGLERRVAQLERRQEVLEAAVGERDEKINLLSRELGFLNKLLEDKTGR